MFQMGRANTIEDVDIIFQIPNSNYSVTQYTFKLIEEERLQSTRLVSGLDSNYPINCTFSFEKPTKDSIVISMFRSPVLYTDILNHKQTMCIAKVITRTHQEFWYVLGVQKGEEWYLTRRITSLMVQDTAIEKTVCVVKGNIPKDLYTSFRYTKITNVNYLHSLCINPPSVVEIVNTPLRFSETNSTASETNY
ncbi:ORF7 [Plodia interpunctella granulovirus]|uniref:ORF7 n=1 Tax=Plodia interpunctella granulovirus TaxID=262175 RepID=A0A1L5JGH2_9BBAC|nr:ORF7 [Plodia interpunctella granulovirus]APO13891.1 ORF7 [Plodia interpunctella granulovirus]